MNKKQITSELNMLLQHYYQAPKLFQAGNYWKAHENTIIDEIGKADISKLRSGRYPIFGKFGFSEEVYYYQPGMPKYLKVLKRIIRFLFITNRATLPYSLRLRDIREMAYVNCLNQGKLAGIRPIYEIGTSSFGDPADLFEMEGKKYTMQFLKYYIRLCFLQRCVGLEGRETIVELGSGSGFQVEVLKKVFPELTILCFDLPYSLVLCEKYLEESLGQKDLVKSTVTNDWTNTELIEKGKVHMLGNWKFPILENHKFDLFWNAASFGEMEPDIVNNYLKYILGSCSFIYLLQARYGKESNQSDGVESPITFEDYHNWLSGYKLIKEEDAFEAHRRMYASGGYFHAVWKLENDQA